MSTLFQSPDLYTEHDTPRRTTYATPDTRRTLSKQRLRTARAWWFTLCLIGFAVLWYLDPGRTYVPPPPPPAYVTPVPHPPSPGELLDKLAFVGPFLIRETLLTPTMARFPADRMYVQHDADRPYTFTVGGDVDSQNAFGAMLRQPYAIELRYTCPQTAGYDVACWQVLRYRLGNHVYNAPKTATKTR